MGSMTGARWNKKLGTATSSYEHKVLGYNLLL